MIFNLIGALNFGLCLMKTVDFWEMVLEEVGTEQSNTEPGSEPSNESVLPLAEVGLDQSVFTGDTVTLDGSSSIGEQFVWAQSYGDTVTLDDGNQQNPFYVAEMSGTFAFDLQVSIGSVSDRVIVGEHEDLDNDEQEKGGCSHLSSIRNWEAIIFVLLSHR